MELSPDVVRDEAESYPNRQPMFSMEQEHRSMLPNLLGDGDFGWRDAEWVVQWHFRRHLGAYPDRSRRDAENAYGDNDYEAVADALAAARTTDDLEEKFTALTQLRGVGGELASAFLHYLHPEEFLVVSGREWSVLEAAGRVERSYPDSLTIDEYSQYLEACRTLATTAGCELRTVYQAVWMLSTDYEF
ncbi:MAG: hypothetical protein A07HR60_00391 [uncultured archaeon A07HR60]|nr:MAG: hypothetical protein A07HR60_00391 [uncultured archaeon A07HR60]